MSNVSLRTREHRVSYWQMTYIELLNSIPTFDRASFNSCFRKILYEDVPIKRTTRIISELARVFPTLKKLIPQRG